MLSLVPGLEKDNPIPTDVPLPINPNTSLTDTDKNTFLADDEEICMKKGEEGSKEKNMETDTKSSPQDCNKLYTEDSPCDNKLSENVSEEKQQKNTFKLDINVPDDKRVPSTEIPSSLKAAEDSRMRRDSEQKADNKTSKENSPSQEKIDIGLENIGDPLVIEPKKPTIKKPKIFS